MPVPERYRSDVLRGLVRGDRQRAVGMAQTAEMRRLAERAQRLDEVVDRRQQRTGTRIVVRRTADEQGRIASLAEEFFVRTRELTPEAEQAIADSGYSLEPVAGLRDYVRRAVATRARQTGRSDVAGGGPEPISADDARAVLGDHGVPTSLSYVTAYEANVKSGPTPEASLDPPPAPPPAVFDDDVRAVDVLLLDTGCTERGDGWLAGVVTADNLDPLNVPGPGQSAPDAYLDLAAGHGTFAAGIVQQVAPHARLHIQRVLDTDGIATEQAVATALTAAVSALLDSGVRRLVVNLSLGTETDDDLPPLAFEAALDVVNDLQAEHDAEVVVVAAAGNSGVARPCWPAAFQGVVAVAALDQDGRPAPWSSRGAWVDCSAVGVAVQSTFVPGVESPELDPQPETFGPDAWALWTGTSFTAPQVAGMVAHIAHVEDRSLRWALRRLLAGQHRFHLYGRALDILP